MSEPNITADALASIADLIRGGMAAPIAISIGRSGVVNIQPHADDLDAWITLMELDWPMWDVRGEHAHARWSDETFASLPFSLSACRRLVAEVAS